MIFRQFLIQAARQNEMTIELRKVPKINFFERQTPISKYFENSAVGIFYVFLQLYFSKCKMDNLVFSGHNG